MPKIAYLTSQYPATSHTFIRREVEALRARGLDISTFSIRMPAPAEQDDPENRGEFQSTTYVLPIRPFKLLGAHLRALVTRPLRYFSTLRDALRHRAPGLKAFFWALFHFAETIQLAYDLEKRGISHVHNHFANSAATVGFLASRFSRLGFSLTLHGISEFDYPAGLVLREKIEHADFVACVSHFGRAQAQRITSPDEWPKLFINRCGIDTRRFVPGQALERGRLRVLHVGRLSSEKGQVGLIEAFAEVVRGGVDAELRIIGDGPEEARVRQAITTEGMEDRIFLLGRKGEEGVVDELSHADAFVMASFMEGLPVVLMEALAAQVPVVAPRVAGIPELAIHDRSGLLFAPGDFDDLAEQLRRLLTDAELRVSLAKAGREMVLEEFEILKAVLPIARKLAPEMRHTSDIRELRPPEAFEPSVGKAPSLPPGRPSAEGGQG